MGPAYCNPNWLYLFFFVAKYKGIRPAAPNVGYGIQQPALSQAMLELEDWIGHRLFERFPFKLLPSGEMLFRLLKVHGVTLFEGLETLRNQAPILRIGAPSFIMEEYLVTISDVLQAKYPRLRFEFRSGTSADLYVLLGGGELDTVITIGAPPTKACTALPLLSLPVALLVKQPPGGKRALPKLEDLLPGGVATGPLICPTGHDVLFQQFDGQLKGRGKTWVPSSTASTIAEVASFVTKGRGIGLGVDYPDLNRPKKVCAVGSGQLGTVEVYAVSTGRPSPELKAFIAAVQERAAVTSSNSAVPFAPKANRPAASRAAGR